MRTRLLAVALIAGCGHGTPAPQPPGDDLAATDDGGDMAGPTDGDDADGSTEAPEVLAERIAAVQWSMGQLEGAAHLCWAAAAVDDFHLGGAWTATLTFAAPVASAPPTVHVDRDEPADPVLTPCLVQALQAFRWPPPLAGETVQLPFEFQAPKAQYVIDRTMVPVSEEAHRTPDSFPARTRVLVDAQNTGQAGLTVVEVAPGTTGTAAAIGAELWIATSPLAIDWKKSKRVLAVGDVVAAGAGHRVAWSGGGDFRTGGAIVIALAGGIVPRDGVAVRAPGGSGGPAAPMLALHKDAKTYTRTGGSARFVFDPTRIKGAPDVAVLEQVFEAGTAAPTHTHDATEVIYVTAGRGTTTIDGVTVDVGPTSVIVIPPGVEHSFSVIDEIHAIQVYAPGGPGQRYKAATP